MAKTLIVCPHMDDESISCGGLIQKRLQEGHQVGLITVYGRVYDYGAESVKDSLLNEKTDFQNACAFLGEPTVFHVMNLKEGEPAQVGYYRVLKKVENCLDAWKPDEVVGPAADDLNQDHRQLSHVLDIALRPTNLGSVKRHLEFFALDGTARQPTYFVPLTMDQVSVKLKAISAYRREAREGNSPRAARFVVAQLRVWGAACGHDYAEGYRLKFAREA